MPEFDVYFPTSPYGSSVLNVMAFGAYADGAAHPLNTLGYANLAAAQVDYPSATSLNDTADWCAITECFKQAFRHETTPGVWVPNGTDTKRNRSVCFPQGRYITRKPIKLESVQGVCIYGLGAGNTEIYNETNTTPNNVCFAVNGLSFSRIENLNFVTAGGAEGTAFDLNCDGGAGAGGVATVNTNGNTFISCGFSSPAGVGLNIADPSSPVLSPSGYMGSEMTFIRCTAGNCHTGFVIQNWNALNYVFMGCGASECSDTGIKVASGGMVTIINGSFAANGDTAPDGYDVLVGGGTCSIITTRTESKKFVKANAPTSLIACVQDMSGSQTIFIANASNSTALNCLTQQGRIAGDGPITLDGCTFSMVQPGAISAVAAGTSSRVKITHAAHPGAGTGLEYFLDGDEVEVRGLTSTGGGAAATNGVWTIAKLSATQLELVGSTFIAGTYTYTNAVVAPGPRFHLRDYTSPVPDATLAVAATPFRSPQTTRTKNLTVTWLDSGGTFDNLGATGPVVFTLPRITWPSWRDVRGASFKFIVLAGQTITVQVNSIPASGASAPRIFRAGGYATAGTNIASNVIGNSIEIYLADGRASDSAEALLGHRWLVRSEAGTWTIAGTPAP